MDSAANAARLASEQIASGLQQFQKLEERAKEAQAERERNPDNEFTLLVKEAMSSTDSKEVNRVLNEALNRGVQGELLAAIQEERGLPENLGSQRQAKLLAMEAQAELGDLSRKTNAELLTESEKANGIVFGESPDKVKNPVKRRLIEEELGRRQTERQSQIRQQNTQRMQAVQAERQVQKTQDDLRTAMRELQKANRALGKPRLRGLKTNQKELDAAAIRGAKAKAMLRAIDENKGVVPALQDPKAILSTPSPVYRVLQAGQNIEELIQAYEKALGELNNLRK